MPLRIEEERERDLLLIFSDGAALQGGEGERTLEALGIKRHQQTVIHNDTPAIRGMINQISHMVQVTDVEE